MDSITLTISGSVLAMLEEQHQYSMHRMYEPMPLEDFALLMLKLKLLDCNRFLEMEKEWSRAMAECDAAKSSSSEKVF